MCARICARTLSIYCVSVPGGRRPLGRLSIAITNINCFHGAVDSYPCGPAVLILSKFPSSPSLIAIYYSQELMGYDILIATTKVVNGQTLLDPFVAKLS